MGCATATIKYLVFLFNALCALLGIGVIVVSSLALDDVDSENRPSIIFFIVIGSIVFLISFFGCCGAIKEHICLTWLYAIIMLVLLILSCVLSFAYVKKIDADKMSLNILNNTWTEQKNNTHAMDHWQKEFKCCGINGPDDYTQAKLTIPESCYAPTNGTSTIKTLYPDGCLHSVSDVIHKALKYVDIFSWTLIGVEGAAFLCASILAITFGNDQRRSRY
ncbi:hypothetical protein KR222_004738 [Zaprionus bogoriensis]|nr:hypothetical protein KR222_004738 [Zaprionus bogoriensis]